jgi:competence protein ComEC
MRILIVALALPLALLAFSTTSCLDRASSSARYTAAAADASAVVYITDTGDKYHQSDCRYLKDSKIETTLTKAKTQGYKPCSVCKPPK